MCFPSVILLLAVSQTIKSETIVLGYKSTRPFYAGVYKPYPEPIVRYGNPQSDKPTELSLSNRNPQVPEASAPNLEYYITDHVNPQTQTFGDRFGEQTSTNYEAYINSNEDNDNDEDDSFIFPNEVPSSTLRDFIYLPDFIQAHYTDTRYGEPHYIPQSPSNVGDRFGESTTQQVPNLNYVPSRPFYAGVPKPYPEPNYNQLTTPDRFGQNNNNPGIQSSVPSLNNKPTIPSLASKPGEYPGTITYPTNKPLLLGTILDFDDSLEKTTKMPSSASSSSSVPNLSYVPERPFYAGKPKPYPEPIIRPTKPENVDNRFGENNTQTSTVPDLNYKPSRPPFAGQPEGYPKPVNKPEKVPELSEEDLDDRFGETTTKVTTFSVPNLNYVPSRPFYAGKPKPYPEPIIRPKPQDIDHRFGENNTQTSTVPDLNYKPSRPPFAGQPDEYPKPVNKPENVPELSEENLDDRFGETTTKLTTSSVPNLNYVPSRPFYAGKPKPYPEPIIRPKPEDLNNKFGENNSQTPTTVTDLNYKPSRPPFAGNPEEYPKPVNHPEFVDRFGESTSTKPPYDIPVFVYYPPQGENPPKVPNLSYVPLRPFYAGKPRPYPEPIIRPKPQSINNKFDDRFGPVDLVQPPEILGTPSTKITTTTEPPASAQLYYDKFIHELQLLYDSYVERIQKLNATLNYTLTSEKAREMVSLF